MKLIVNNKDLAKANGLKVGEPFEVKDRKGVPVDAYWRNRLTDAKKDKSVSIAPKESAKPLAKGGK